MDELRITVRVFFLILIGYEAAFMAARDDVYHWLGMTMPDPVAWLWTALNGLG